jgi:hypothetical protein
MAVVCGRKVLGLPKRLAILKFIQTFPVIYARCSSDISRHSWEPVEKETHTGQVCYEYNLYSYNLTNNLGTQKALRTILFSM